MNNSFLADVRCDSQRVSPGGVGQAAKYQAAKYQASILADAAERTGRSCKETAVWDKVLREANIHVS